MSQRLEQPSRPEDAITEPENALSEAVETSGPAELRGWGVVDIRMAVFMARRGHVDPVQAIAHWLLVPIDEAERLIKKYAAKEARARR